MAGCRRRARPGKPARLIERNATPFSAAIASQRRICHRPIGSVVSATGRVSLFLLQRTYGTDGTTAWHTSSGDYPHTRSEPLAGSHPAAVGCATFSPNGHRVARRATYGWQSATVTLTSTTLDSQSPKWSSQHARKPRPQESTTSTSIPKQRVRSTSGSARPRAETTPASASGADRRCWLRGLPKPPATPNPRRSTLMPSSTARRKSSTLRSPYQPGATSEAHRALTSPPSKRAMSAQAPASSSGKSKGSTTAAFAQDAYPRSSSRLKRTSATFAAIALALRTPIARPAEFSASSTASRRTFGRLHGSILSFPLWPTENA